MLRKLLVVLLVLVLLLAATPDVHAHVVHGKVTVCKNGHTRTMNSRAAASQYTNGVLTYGACE
jgi:ABC-type oligopeptide transport system substrate-binding subunit